MSERIPVAVLGATGLVGQHLVRLLEGHPWFRLAEVGASKERAGLRYGASVDGYMVGELPRAVGELRLLGPEDRPRSPLILSALPSDVASLREPELTRAGYHVSSNASAGRLRAGVPLVIPEVNGEALIDSVSPVPARWITNPNCVVAGVALVLAPLNRRWGVASGVAVTLQALSGAGLSGPSALQMAANVIPHIPGEEDKIEVELGRILGTEISLAVTCNRVPVVDGHLVHLMLRLGAPVEPAEVCAALNSFRAPPSIGALPSLPDRPVVVLEARDRPQPRLDAGRGGGMQVTVGRVRRTPGFDIALTLVVHNAIRGAAGGCLANAELLAAAGALGGHAGRLA